MRHTRVSPSPVYGAITIPPSKSETIRALFMALLATGESYIANPLRSTDGHAAQATCASLGAHITDEQQGYRITGCGGRVRPRRSTINVGNSGTALRIATAIAGLSHRQITLDGDAHTRRRPMTPLVHSLCQLGATARGRGMRAAHAPITVRGPLIGGNTTIACPTSQYLTALLLVCPLLPQDTTITVTDLNEHPYIDMTMGWLHRQGVRVHHDGYKIFHIRGNQRYTSFEYTVEGDYSSATFLLAAGAIAGGQITISNLLADSRQGDRAVVDLLRNMGLTIDRHHNTLTAQRDKQSASPLRAIDCSLNAMPDALPALMAVACYARGQSVFRDIAHTRIKESDRITVMACELRTMGAHIDTYPDRVTVHGSPHAMRGAHLDSHGDHRIAMALTVAALAARGETIIHNSECVAVTYPDFFETIDSITEKGSIHYE